MALSSSGGFVSRLVKFVADENTLADVEIDESVINTNLVEICESLTVETFSQFPLEDLPPEEPLEGRRLTHAKTMLEKSSNLATLRYDLCPSKMDEKMFWTIYFALIKRIAADLLKEPRQSMSPEPPSNVECELPEHDSYFNIDEDND
mmetsp:Transcript_21940/g.51444  ORF Transcript_21940/g.51444 Transcript_21940/m.51444 type:complete len:148 (+) Transcript_21940:40-483(+)